MPDRSVLLTGGAGFIGSNIAHALTAMGHAVTICDSFGQTMKWRNLLSSDIAALVSPDRIADHLATARHDIVIHMGAISATTETDVDLITRSNVDLSLLLWDYCASRGARFIYASSAATYGDGTMGFDDLCTNESLSRLRPLNAYGWSKLLVDRIITKRVEQGERAPPQWVGLRFFNVFGPNEHHKGDMRSVVCKVYDQIQSGAPVTLFKSNSKDFTDGGQKRDFIYVDDCVRAISYLLDTPSVSGIFNLGTGKARTWLDLVNAIFAALGLEPRVAFIDMPQHITRQYQNFTEARMERLRQAGFTAPFQALEDSVADYVTRYLMASHPYR